MSHYTNLKTLNTIHTNLRSKLKSLSLKNKKIKKITTKISKFSHDKKVKRLFFLRKKKKSLKKKKKNIFRDIV